MRNKVSPAVWVSSTATVCKRLKPMLSATQTSPFASLTDDCIVAILQFVPVRVLGLVARVNRRLYNATCRGTVWRHLELDSTYERSMSLLGRLLSLPDCHCVSLYISPRCARAWTSDTAVSDVFPASLFEEAKRVREADTVRVLSEFLTVYERFLSRVGGGIRTLRLEDRCGSFLFRFQDRLFSPVIRHCGASVRRLDIAGEDEYDYADVLGLLRGLPSVINFVDDQSFGLTLQSLLGVTTTWPLQHLKTNTILKAVTEFSACIYPLRTTLRSLSIKHFRDPLFGPKGEPNFTHLLFTLSQFPHLSRLELDLTGTPHADGLRQGDLRRLVESVPGLRVVELTVCLESYSLCEESAIGAERNGETRRFWDVLEGLQKVVEGTDVVFRVHVV